MEGGNISNNKQSSIVHFKIPSNNFPSLSNPCKKQDNVGTNQLKQSNWYADAVRSIQESEYEIKPAENQNTFASPNRQQNLKAFYTADKFILEPREKDNWKLQLTLKGVYSGRKKIYSPEKDAVAVTEKNKIQFNHNDEFTVEYINSKEGVRQNFIIQKQPTTQPQTLNLKLQTNKGWFINKVHAKEIHFAKNSGSAIEKKLTYNDLKVWDANHKELAAHFETKQNEIEIVADVKNAVYPITIDPISTTPVATLNGISTGDNFGISVASAGDVNGDGFSDVIIGAFGVSSNKGAAYIFTGSNAGLSVSPATTLNGINTSDNFGYSVASAGDVNGDGYSDVVVGAFGVLSNKGAAYIFTGSNIGLSVSPATTLNGINTNDNFGISVASAGDVNGDGYSDVVVGAFGVLSNKGAAYIFTGSNIGLSVSPATTLNGINGGDYFGISVACAGDINGDGYSDVITGAYGVSSNKGAAYIFTGGNTGVSASPATTLNGISTSDNFGYSVACIGDINGDGYSDVVAGAYVVSSNKGAAYIFTGSNTGLSVSPATTLNGIIANGQFAYSLASAGDINGDGYSDLIIGANNVSSSTGAAYTYHGSPNGLVSSPVIFFNGAAANDQFGHSVVSAGDVNGDGYSDVVIGAHGEFSNKGAAYLFLGSSNGLSASPATTLNGSAPGDYFGYSVACAGDVNGDGYSDIIVGAIGVSSRGAAYIFPGSSTGLLSLPVTTLNGISPGDNFGYSVAGAGDINGDGYGDVIAGAIGVSSKGAAYTFLGNSTGILTSSTILNGSSSGDQFGGSVASAGDINGDGYSDVVVGASNVLSTGAAYIFIGNSTGLTASPATTLNGISTGGQFGVSVAGAGDVNGDGYGDVVVGALGVSSNTGAAYVFPGSSTGLLTSSTILNGISPGDYFGISVASAGDVNGDGYSDVIIGANNIPPAGAVYIFPGSSAGLTVSPATTLNGVSTNSFGYSVASAGDVNGDGYSDIIAGAPNHSSSAGAAYIYQGNSNSGIRNNLRLYDSDTTHPIRQANMADPNLFGAGFYAKSFIGRQRGKLTWQTVRNGNPFSGTPITNSTAFTAQQIALTDLGLTGIELKDRIAKMVPTKATYIRARVKYDLSTAITGQVYGPWRYPEGFLRGRRDIGAVALPVKFISFTAVKQNEAVLLKWITTDETAGINYEVQHSADGINFITIKTIPAQNNSRNEYEWLHADPAKGKNYYRIRAVDNGKDAFTATRQVTFQSAGLIKLYPNPVKSGEALTIESTGNTLPGPITVEISDMSGQKKAQYLFSSFNTTTVIPLPELPAGQYILKVINGKNVLYANRFLVMK
jgi:hypothetical protein